MFFCILLNFSYGNFNNFYFIEVAVMHLILLNSGVNRKYCLHCVKSFQIRTFFWSVFSRVCTEYGDFLCICCKINGRRNSSSGQFPHIVTIPYLPKICSPFFFPQNFYVASVSKQHSVFRYFRLFSRNNWQNLDWKHRDGWKKIFKSCWENILLLLVRWWKADLFILYKIQKQLFRGILLTIKCK